jgi:general secretion pathway protein E
MTALQKTRRAAVLDRLRDIGKIDESALARAELVSSRTGQPVEQVLNQLGALADEDLAEAYAHVSGCAIWVAERQPPTLDLQALAVPEDFLRRARILPLRRVGQTLECAVADPLDDQSLASLVFAVGGTVKAFVARPGDLNRAFTSRAGAAASPALTDERRLAREIDQVSDLGGAGTGARFVAAALEAAVAAGASDIHFEPRRHDFRVRLRIDGQLVDFAVASADVAPSAISRIKVIANLNVGERRLPQDGRTSFVVQGRSIDVRVATAPTVFGEGAVLRLLDRANLQLDIDALGFGAREADILRRVARSPHGLFLVTGPTGSGKTTTLYALLQTLASSSRKVLSVEDPVEYHFDHVSQTQVAPQIGLTFAAALRSFLRQDPDVILVGEIRDPETAAVAIQAAMTGHFVLASVHANDAVAIAPRLLDMGVEAYQLAAALRGAAAQRLVRKLCPACSVLAPATDAHRVFLGNLGLESPSHLRKTVGCPECSDTGFRGRVAIGEAFLATEPLLRATAAQASTADLAALAARDGFTPMVQDGGRKAIAGVTTLDEVLAAIHV